jgi:hypothetical protein
MYQAPMRRKGACNEHIRNLIPEQVPPLLSKFFAQALDLPLRLSDNNL